MTPDEARETARNLYEQGMSARDIAPILGCAVGHVYHYLKGVPKRADRLKVTEDMIDQMRDLRAQHFTIREVSEMVGTSHHSVAKYTADIAVDMRGRNPTPADCAISNITLHDNPRDCAHDMRHACRVCDYDRSIARARKDAPWA